MNISLCIEKLFPSAIFDKDYTILNDGNGSYIGYWNLSEPQPTQVELEAAWLTICREIRIKEIKRQAGLKIESIMPIYKQLNVLRETGATDPRFAQIDSVRSQSNQMEAEVNALTDTNLIEEYPINFN